MNAPRVKQFILKLLILLFLPDYRTVYRQYLDSRRRQEELKEILQTVTPADIQEAKLQYIAECMSDLQKAIYQLNEQGLTNNEIAQKLNLPLRRIHKHLEGIETEIHRLYRYMK